MTPKEVSQAGEIWFTLTNLMTPKYESVMPYIPPKIPDIKDCYTLTEAQSKLKISESKLLQLIDLYKIPKLRKGNSKEYIEYVPKKYIDEIKKTGHTETGKSHLPKVVPFGTPGSFRRATFIDKLDILSKQDESDEVFKDHLNKILDKIEHQLNV